MSLDAVKQYFYYSDYRPLSNQLMGDPNLMKRLSRMAKAVLMTFINNSSQDVGFLRWVDLIPPKPWDRVQLRLYETLSSDEKAEVLGVATYLLHEVTHHMDYMTTPFGVHVRARACLEYLTLQEMARPLQWGVWPLDRTLVDVVAPSFKDRTEWPEPAATLRSCVLFADAIRGAKKSHIDVLTHEGRSSGDILGQTFIAVSVHGWLSSAAVPSNPGRYVTPTAILEARALTHSLLHLQRMLQDPALVKEEIARYMSAFYNPAHVSPEYLFLLDLLAGAVGRTSFTDVLETADMEAVRQILLALSSVTWYALQAPPFMSDDGYPFNSDPCTRLLVALGELERWSASPASAPYRDLNDFLVQIDERDAERDEPRRFRQIEDILDFTIRYIDYVRTRNNEENKNEQLRRHFDYVLAAQSRQLRRRLGHSYRSRLGLPPHGNPLFGVDNDQDADDLLLDYQPHPDVQAWFTYREHLLFKITPSESEKRGQLARHFPELNA